VTHAQFRQANDPETPQETFLELSKTDDELILGALALDPSSPEHVISELEKTESQYIRECLRQRRGLIRHES